MKKNGPLTKIIIRVTRAFPVGPISTFWTMGKEIVLVSDILKEVDLVFALEKSSRNAVYYGISPALNNPSSARKIGTKLLKTHLVVETSRGVEMFKVLCICFSPPQVHIRDFEVTPDCGWFGIIRAAL